MQPEFCAAKGTGGDGREDGVGEGAAIKVGWGVGSVGGVGGMMV